MASGPSRIEASCVRPLCRNFARGFCRRGHSCRFSHDRKSAQVCRYFQSGFCRYGEQCSYQHTQEEPAAVGTQCGLMPCSQEPGTEPTATDQDQGGAQCTSAHPAHSMMCVACKLPKGEAEVEEKDKNIPALGNVPCGAISGEFVATKAQAASDSQPQGPALDLDSSDPREAVLETATWTDPAKVGLGSPVAGRSLSPCDSARARGLPCCAALLAGPCRARCCGSPGHRGGAESPERGCGVWDLHGQGVREGAARGAALWDPPELQPRILRGVHPQVAAQPRLPERRRKVSGDGDVAGWSPSPFCALKLSLGSGDVALGLAWLSFRSSGDGYGGAG
uniref:RING-type E3 ubiquitin transferase n=1 Tax=Ficedula albicollis TaxID=59894 RepID=A0A803WFY7_FICAL